MERITLNIEGTSDEVATALKRLTGVLEQGQEAESRGEWSQEEIQRFWQALRPDCKSVFRIISRTPDGCARRDILRELNLTGNQLAGILSSQGHALHSFPGKPRPVELDPDTWVYRMRQEFAEFLSDRGQ